MILLLDTATPTCRICLIDESQRVESEWIADRQLAKGLLSYIHEQLNQQGKSWTDLTGLGVNRGPGSFTGLRIGITVLNTLADSLQIPIIGANGENWKNQAIDSLQNGENDRIVLPLYDREANITSPRK